MTYPEWVHQSVVKIVCFQSECECISICKNVSDICNNIFCRSMTGSMCGESVPDVVALILPMVCAETIQM